MLDYRSYLFMRWVFSYKTTNWFILTSMLYDLIAKVKEGNTNETIS